MTMVSRRPRILLNATTLNKGGGIQAAVSFIRSLLACRIEDSFDWYLAISPEVGKQLASLGLHIDLQKDLLLKDSPAKNHASRRALLDRIDLLQINGVFTFFGPAYVQFPVPHICGVADGWVTHSDWEAYRRIPSWPGRARMLALCLYKTYWFRKADAWIVEQDEARRGLARRALIDAHRVHIVSNNCAEHYHNDDTGRLLTDGTATRVLIFASYYPNKNIELVPYVARALADRTPNAEFEFVLTLPDNDFQTISRIARRLGVEKAFRNVGPVPIADGPSLYRSCDILLMPSVLETFSAVYPEAMVMGLPIVSSDKPFARAICGDAATYFSVENPGEAAEAILKLQRDSEFRQRLIDRGNARAVGFPSPGDKYRMVHQLIERYVQ